LLVSRDAAMINRNSRAVFSIRSSKTFANMRTLDASNDLNLTAEQPSSDNATIRNQTIKVIDLSSDDNITLVNPTVNIDANVTGPIEIMYKNNDTNMTDNNQTEFSGNNVTVANTSVNVDNATMDGLNLTDNNLTVINSSISAENATFDGLNLTDNNLTVINSNISAENATLEGLDAGNNNMTAVNTSIGADNATLNTSELEDNIVTAINSSISAGNISSNDSDIVDNNVTPLNFSLDLNDTDNNVSGTPILGTPQDQVLILPSAEPISAPSPVLNVPSLTSDVPIVTSDRPTVSAQGTASQNIVPDTIVVNIQISTPANTAAAALAANNAATARANQIFAANNINNSSISSSRFTINQDSTSNRINPMGQRLNTTLGYVATNNLHVNFTTLSATTRLIDRLANVTEVSITGISFKTSDSQLQTVTNSLLQNAVVDARNKASVAIVPLAYSIIGVSSITVNSQPSAITYTVPFDSFNAYIHSTGTTVNASVTVVYYIQSQV